MRVLVVEKDTSLGAFLQKGFSTDCCAVDLTENGKQAESMFRERAYDLAILDLSSAKEEGLATLQHLRASKQNLPILILTNCSEVLDVGKAFDMGADDFVLKPFAFAELSARVEVLLRRAERSPESMLRVLDLELNCLEHSVKRANRTIELTPKEFSLLKYLMRNAGQQLTRSEIIGQVWNLPPVTLTNVVDVYINYLRKKVDAGAEQKLIRTIRGIGYQLDPGSASGKATIERRRASNGD